MLQERKDDKRNVDDEWNSINNVQKKQQNKLQVEERIQSNSTKRHINRLQEQQNKCLRIILSADIRTHTVGLHQAAGIPLVADYIHQAAQRFYEKKTATHDNPLTRGITSTCLVEERHRMLYQNLPIYNTPGSQSYQSFHVKSQ